MLKNKRVFVSIIFTLLFSTAFLFSAGKSNIEEGKYYINKAINEKKVGGVISGPYENLEEAIANWIASNQREDSFFCISKDSEVIATKPSKELSETFDPIFEDFLNNPEETSQKYDVELSKGAIKRLESERKKIAKKTGKEFAEIPEIEKDESDDAPAILEPEIIIPEDSEPEDTEEVSKADSKKKKRSKKDKKKSKEEESVAEEPTENDAPAILEETEEDKEPELTEEQLAAIKAEEERREAERIAAEQAEAARLEAERIAAEKEAQEKARQEEAIKKALENVNKNTSVSRYQKEYLQDYMKDEVAELPDDFEAEEIPLIANPDEKDSNGQTLLMKAAKTGNEWQLSHLIRSGADINAKDKDGWTALMYAVRYQESLGAVNQLINSNADVKAKNNYDSSALLIAACYNNNPEILRKILTFYSISEKDVLKAFTQLLSSTLIKEYVQIAKINIFLEKSIQLNTFYEGKTPLMYAAQFGTSTKVIKLLLDNGCITTVRSTEGKTAFEYASKNTKLKHDDNYWALNLK